MIAISEYKNEVIRKVLEVENSSILKEVEQILLGNDVVAYTTDGKPLTRLGYKLYIENISHSIKNGAKTFSGEEVRNFILRDRK